MFLKRNIKDLYINKQKIYDKQIKYIYKIKHIGIN